MTELLRHVHLNEGHVEAARWEPGHVTLKDDQERPPGLTDFAITVPFLMASLRFVDLLRSFQCKCEYLPLVAHYRGREIEGEFFALNSLYVVSDALDLKRSKFGFYDEELCLAEDVRSLTLNEAALGDEPLSYLREISTFAVNGSLAQAIDDAALIGIKLVKPEEFRG